MFLLLSTPLLSLILKIILKVLLPMASVYSPSMFISHIKNNSFCICVSSSSDLIHPVWYSPAPYSGKTTNKAAKFFFDHCLSNMGLISKTYIKHFKNVSTITKPQISPSKKKARRGDQILSQTYRGCSGMRGGS